MTAGIEYDKGCTAVQENIFVVSVMGIKHLISLLTVFVEKFNIQWRCAV